MSLTALAIQEIGRPNKLEKLAVVGRCRNYCGRTADDLLSGRIGRRETALAVRRMRGLPNGPPPSLLSGCARAFSHDGTGDTAPVAGSR